MKILITLGTTKFDTLCTFADTSLNKHDVTIQSKYSHKNVQNCKVVPYVDAFIDYCKNFDVVITHAGAGNIYNLLEAGIKIIIVPNMERTDPHQSDIAEFMKSNCFALVCFDLQKLPSRISEIQNFQPQKFSPTRFNSLQFNNLLKVK